LTQKNFTTTLKTKLDGIEANATADQTAAQILAAIKTVDGEGSGLDADTLDGLSSGSFFRSNTGNSTDVRIAAGDGRGVRFWDSDSYKIWMSASTNGTWGGRLDTTSDYNMYFRMSGGTNRGFVFQNSTTEVMQIQSDGTILTANDGNSEQWNTAYGWGNHASGGYSTASGVEDNADVTDTANVVAALTAGTNVQIAANGTISATDTNTQLTTAEVRGKVSGTGLIGYNSSTGVISTTANNYVHPTTAGNKHIPSGGSAGQFLKYSASGTAVWAADNNTTYSNATTSASGLMSSTDKTKLNGIASGADNYTGWNFVDTTDTATRIDSLEYFKIAGSNISGTGTSADPYLVNTPDTDTNTWRPIDATPTNGATGDSISSDWAYDNVRNFSNGGNSLAGTFTATGDVVAYSDVRVKENIQDIDNALDKVTQLRGVKYNKIGSNEKSIGVIAQEIQKILPEVVREDQDGMLGVSYGNITAVLIEAIKEQQKQIDELKAQLNGITK
jgi:hypothetical protein